MNLRNKLFKIGIIILTVTSGAIMGLEIVSKKKEWELLNSGKSTGVGGIIPLPQSPNKARNLVRKSLRRAGFAAEFRITLGTPVSYYGKRKKTDKKKEKTS